MDRGRLLSLRIISESLLCAEGIICAYMIPSYGGNIILMERKFSIEGGPRCFLVVGVVVRQRGLLRRWGSKVRKMVGERAIVKTEGLETAPRSKTRADVPAFFVALLGRSN
jgi:hypothetical protein